MFHLLPDELNETIIYHIQADPIQLYHLQYVNGYFLKCIKWIKNYPFNNYDKTRINTFINELCCKQTPLQTFLWLFQNNIKFNQVQINNLIRYNRIHIIKHGMIHNNFIDVLFSKNQYHNFWSHKETYPLFVAGKYGRLEIIQLLLDLNKYNNPNFNHIYLLFNVCINLRNKSIIKYLVINHYDILKKHKHFTHDLFNLHNIEDILFYLLLSKKINISEQLFHECIKYDYKEVFTYCWKQYIDKKNLPYEDFILQCFHYNRKFIVCFLINNYQLHHSILIEYKKNLNHELIYYMINNHIDIFHRSSELIKIAIHLQLSYECIETLIKEKFIYGFNELQLTLDYKNLQLLKLLCYYL